MSELIEKKKKTRGRQKIEMKLISDKEDRVITFSKRKGGIFKKASEISIMCGAKVLFILFSPVGKAYSFGHPSVKSVADKFYNREILERNQIREILETHLNNKVENQVMQHEVIKSEIEAINGEVSALVDVNKFQSKGWWEANLNEINNKQELEQMLKSIDELQAALSNHLENLKMQNAMDASYDPLGDVNHFLQNNVNVQNIPMMTWKGGDLPGVGGFGEFDNSLTGVNVAVDQPGVGIGQGGDLTLPPAAGGYDASLSGWSGLGAGYDGFPSGAGLSEAGPSSAAFGDHGDGAGLSGVDMGGGSFGDTCASGFGDNFINWLPDFP